MSVTKPASTVADPVLAAFDNAPIDNDALTPDEAAAVAARMADAERAGPPLTASQLREWIARHIALEE